LTEPAHSGDRPGRGPVFRESPDPPEPAPTDGTPGSVASPSTRDRVPSFRALGRPFERIEGVLWDYDIRSTLNLQVRQSLL
jgi:hypothetical protein